MRTALVMALGLLTVAPLAGLAEEKQKASNKYLTKDGKLTHELEVTEREGSGLGGKSRRWTVKPDGSWEKAVRDVGVKTTEGKLSKEQLAELAKAMETYKLDALKSQRDKRNDGKDYQLTYGSGFKVVRNVSTNGPLGKPDEKTMKGRYAGIVATLEKLLKDPEKSKGKEKSRKDD